jgi:hypothetical protein
MLTEITTTPELLEMVASSIENGSETDSSQNEKKSSYQNLKNGVASLKRKKKKTLLASLILIILCIDLFYKIFDKEKR